MFQYPVKIRKVAIIANTNDYVKTNIKPGFCSLLITETPDFGRTTKGKDWQIIQGNLHMSLGAKIAKDEHMQCMTIFLMQIF